jgi:hypothetical protein
MKSLLKKKDPFPHIAFEDFYDRDELTLVWQEINFISRFKGTESFYLDHIYTDRKFSNLLRVNRKIFLSGVLTLFSEMSSELIDCSTVSNDLTLLKNCNNVDKENSLISTTSGFAFSAFSSFFGEIEEAQGGRLHFPQHDYNLELKHNALTIVPGYVKYEVKKIPQLREQLQKNLNFLMVQLGFNNTLSL